MQPHNLNLNPPIINGDIMKSLPKSTTLRLALALAAGLAASTISSQAQGAVATISDVAAGGGVFDYTITLQNTGTTTLDSFWYAWTKSGNNLSSAASNPGSSLGWVDTGLTGNTSISWEGNAGDALAPGNSATFTFDSTETPTAITTPPAGESVAYVSGTGPNTFGQNQPGASTPVFAPSLAVVPEPSSLGLFTVGAVVLAWAFELRRARRKVS
jgi:hypothetical protein